MEKMPVCDCELVHEDLVAAAREHLRAGEDYARLAELFKLFGDGTRVKILSILEQRRMCVCDLAAVLGVTKSAVSHQLKALRLANLISFQREGQVVYYALADEHVKKIIDTGWEHLYEKREEQV